MRLEPKATCLSSHYENFILAMLLWPSFRGANLLSDLYFLQVGDVKRRNYSPTFCSRPEGSIFSKGIYSYNWGMVVKLLVANVGKPLDVKVVYVQPMQGTVRYKMCLILNLEKFHTKPGLIFPNINIFYTIPRNLRILNLSLICKVLKLFFNQSWKIPKWGFNHA